MIPKGPVPGRTIFSHANKMTQAYHIMLTPLCKETGLPPLAMDILLFLANNPEHNTAKDICRMRGHKSGIVSVHVERLVNDGLLERQEMPGDRRQTRLVCTEQAQARKPRMITIFDLALTQNLGNGQYALRIVCSKGTYIRTLCHDLGQALGCGGCMAALRRTEASNFRIDEAVTLEDVAREGEALLRPTDSLFRQYPAYTIPSTEQERKCLCGNPLRAKLPDGLYRVYGRDGAFLALSEAKDGTLTSKRNFFSV